MQIYLKDHHRQPIRTLPRVLRGDVQQALPVYWCRRCGKEIYCPRQTLCCACRKEVAYVPQ